jgi:hypothetical protein
MLTNLRIASDAATISSPKIGRSVANIGPKPRPKTGTDFSELCKSLLGPSAGDQLQHLTGYPRSTCYRYSSGETVPPVDFFWRLFSSELGELFFTEFMRGCDAPWWQARERHRRMGETIDKVR